MDVHRVRHRMGHPVDGEPPSQLPLTVQAHATDSPVHQLHETVMTYNSQAPGPSECVVNLPPTYPLSQQSGLTYEHRLHQEHQQGFPFVRPVTIAATNPHARQQGPPLTEYYTAAPVYDYRSGYISQQGDTAPASTTTASQHAAQPPSLQAAPTSAQPPAPAPVEPPPSQPRPLPHPTPPPLAADPSAGSVQSASTGFSSPQGGRLPLLSNPPTTTSHDKASRTPMHTRPHSHHRAVPSSSAIPYIPALPAPAAAAPLPESPAAAARRPLCDRIHNATWAVARLFGFQAFNARSPPCSARPPSAPSPAPQWVPASALLAADHLESLLVRNLLPRLLSQQRAQRHAEAAADPASGGGGQGGQQGSAGEERDEDESVFLARQDAAFARAVWELHSHIFLSYEGESGWCRHVGLRARPAAAEAEVLGAAGGAAGGVLHLLLSELALYFLLYSEAANLRHTPELSWFLFWAANSSPAMERLVRGGLAPEQQISDARERRLAMRNGMQSHLRAVQQHLGHDPAACRPEHSAEAAARLAAQLPDLLPALGLPSAPPAPPSAPACPASDALLSCAASRLLFCDLVCHGDGGVWTDLVVAPLFTVLAFELDHMAAQGQEVAHRLGYDDVNESMCRTDVVGRLLEALGVRAAAEAGQAHGALDAITRLGYAPAVASDGEAGAAGRTPGASAASADPRLSDPSLAAAFWADSVFVKTHRERRSWLALLRAFYRVYSLQLVLLHATMAYAFAPGSLRALSSAVLTHAAVAAAERTANWWLTRGARDPLQAARARDSWTSQPLPAAAGKGDAEAGAPDAAAATPPAGPPRSRLSDGGAVEARLERRRLVAVEGAPVHGVFGWLEWVLAAAALLGLFALQYMGPEALRTPARKFWPLAAGGYVAVAAAHALLTTRDGYCVSLSNALRLPAPFRASSQRPAAGCWLERPMAVGWRAAALTALFWLQVLAAKLAFDYFVIMKPMAGQVRLILHRNWLGCTGRYRLFGAELPLRCVDGDLLLVALRVAPFVLVSLVDTQIFYQMVLMVWGVVHGLVSLNLGVAGSWEALRAEFHRAPLRWWARCMSKQAHGAARSAAAAQRRRREVPGGGGVAVTCTAGGACSDDEEGEEYGSVFRVGGPSAWQRPSSSSSLCSLASTSATDSSPPHHQQQQQARKSRLGRASAAFFYPPAADSGAIGDAASASSASTSSPGKGKGKPRGSRARDAASAAELVSMLSGRGDEQVAQWMAFAAAWDAVVEDLRTCDLIGDRERDNLLFTRLPLPATAVVTAAPSTPDAESVSGDSSSAASSASASSATSARPLRPLLLPAFFYAGQVQAVVDSGAASPSQQLVLGELRALLVWLGGQLGLVGAEQAAALLAATCCPAAIDVAHARSREKGLAALRRLLAALAALQEPLPAALAEADVAARRRQSLHSEAAAALDEVLAAAAVEARAVVRAQLSVAKKDKKKWWGKKAQEQEQAPAAGQEGGGAAMLEGDPQAAAAAMLEAVTALRSGLAERPERLVAALALLHPEGRGCGSGSAVPSSASDCSPAPSAELPLLRRVVSTALKMVSLSSMAAQPTGAEARRILGFFVTSLANRQLLQPTPVACMTSWTVLTPMYAEDVMFPLDARAAAEALGLAPPPAKLSEPYDPASELPDLLSETEERVSLMSYIRSMFPKDWDNFRERMGGALGGADLRGASEADFAEGGPLAEHALALQLWASYRGQLLARTVRGMAAYERALRVLAALDCPRPAGVGRREHAAAVEDVVGAKFCHVVASQLYGRNRRSANLRDRWQAESTDVLLEAFPHLRVSYLDDVPTAPGGMGAAAGPAPPPEQQYAVLIRGRPCGSEVRGWEAGMVSDGGATAAAAAAAVAGARAAAGAGERTEELYRVRLPYNRYSKRGVILGEGKPENQNHAVLFCFGEALQTIDMNQDNALAEALKMRSLLGELAPERDSRKAAAAERALNAALQGSGAAAASLPPASEMRRLLGDLRGAERPVAVVGFREWVFSDKAGALGSFAASSEFAFSTMVQRTMAYPANVRLHYGHPDAFNKIFVMTRGGVSKATRQLHVSEDIFGGMNHSLRGGRIKFREYLSCGKGRDMGFDSINAFESKISAGFGEVALSRDLLRMASRVDLWRCLHLYHSLAGNYFNTWLVMGSVYAHVFALLVFALARAAVYRTVVYWPSPPPPPLGTPSLPASAAPSPPPSGGYIHETLAYDTIRVEHVLQLGLLSLLPYVAEVALEQGLARGLLAALAQVVSGSFTFFIFKQQTTATALHSSMLYGGAAYVATGRGFSITSSSFIKLFANYGRSHIALGFELAAMAVAVAATNECAACSYSGLTWGTWLAGLSLVLAPCWFNPMAFSPGKVKRDMRAWAAWLRGEADRELGCTWHQWNRRQLAHSRNESGAQTDRWGNVALSVALRAVPPALLALAAASRLTLRLDKLGPLPGVLRSSWAVFLLTSVLMWGGMAAALGASRRFSALSDRRRWRLWAFWVGLGGVVGSLAFLVGLSRWYSGDGLSNLCLIAYANANLLLAAHRTAEYTGARSRRLRRLVDGGYLLLDSLLGWSVLGLLGALSLAGVVGRVQTTMLFNVTFAKSVKRGSLVKTIGTAKAERGQQGALLGMLEDGDVGSGGGGREGVGSGKERGSRLQLRA